MPFHVRPIYNIHYIVEILKKLKILWKILKKEETIGI